MLDMEEKQILDELLEKLGYTPERIAQLMVHGTWQRIYWDEQSQSVKTEIIHPQQESPVPGISA
jgi:hypothetical protein